MTEPTSPTAEHHAVLTIRCHTERAQAEILSALATVAGELISRVGVASVDLRPKTYSGRSVPVKAASDGHSPATGAER